MYKFVLLIASAAALTLRTPEDSQKAKADNLKLSLQAVAAQEKFEAAHLQAHEAATNNV